MLDKQEQTENIAPPQRRLDVMIAALGTLPFLATLWLLAVLGAQVLEESGAKIAAALKGRQVQPALTGRSMRLKIRAGRLPVTPRPQQWRDAA
jgi:hypothetical protein